MGAREAAGRSDALPFIGGHDGEAWGQDDDGTIFTFIDGDDDWHVWDPTEGGPQPPRDFLDRYQAIATDPPSADKGRSGVSLWWVAVLAVALAIRWGVASTPSDQTDAYRSPAGGVSSGSTTDSEESSFGEKDASASLACEHFENIFDDIAKGFLTKAEMRAKIREVYNDARYSENAEVASSAGAMLAALTAGDLTEEFLSAVDDFRAACGQT